MRQIFEKLYVLGSSEITKDTNLDSLLFIWKNWDHYFTKQDNKNSEVLENVEYTSDFKSKKCIDRDYDNTELFLRYV